MDHPDATLAVAPEVVGGLDLDRVLLDDRQAIALGANLAKSGIGECP
jgi:hypothetical protein